MSDNENTKKEITYVDPIIPVNPDTDFVTNVGCSATTSVRYGIVWTVPTTDEEAQARYDCPLATIIRAGIAQFATRVNYKSVGFDESGDLVEGGHEAMQALADAYKVGRRTTGGKKLTLKAAKADRDAALAVALSMAQEVGLSEDQVAEMIRKHKEANGSAA